MRHFLITYLRRCFFLYVVAAALALAGCSMAASSKASVYSAWPFDAQEATTRQHQTAAALGVPRERTVDLGDGVAMQFMLIPAGKYLMGEAPGQEVTVDKPFYLAKYKVTQAQWVKIMGANPSKHPGDTHPVDTIDWAPATEFARKASAASKHKIRLPSEVEWEWACRAGTATRCYWGDDMSKMGDYCWWRENCEQTTHPVGQKIPNAFGLYDMMGLTWEWCSDGGAEAEKHPLRGATFGSREFMFKSSVRTAVGPPASDRQGFRVAMDIH